VDVEGYSRLIGLDEVGTLPTLTGYRVIIDHLIASHHGRIFNAAGDSLVADFASAAWMLCNVPSRLRTP
jgi:adenylate cyclase